MSNLSNLIKSLIFLVVKVYLSVFSMSMAQTFYVSGEAGNQTNASLLDDPFVSAAGAGSYNLFEGSFGGALNLETSGSNTQNDAMLLNFTHYLSATLREVNWRDDGNVQDDVFDTNVTDLFGNYGSPLTSQTAQDASPLTLGYEGAYFNNASNNGSGSTSTRNAQLLSFNRNVNAFGAFYGDLETGIRDSGFNLTGSPHLVNPGEDGSGRLYAEMVLFDEYFNEIARRNIDVFTLDGVAYDQTQGGSGGSYIFKGNGNKTTRHLGFIDPNESVRHVLVAVGDDDTTYHDGSDSLGNREFLSSFGFTAFAVPEPSVAILFMCGGLVAFRRSRE